ncbi:MAG TPA: PEP-CTERM sorting domain-containing protein [Verrucomicrobiae bacterium]
MKNPSNHKIAALALLGVATFQLATNSSFAQTVTNAFDKASNPAYSGGNFDTGYNGGFGFGAWTLSTSGGGHYVGGGGNFGLWNNGFGAGTGSFATRPFNSSLAVGQTFSISLEMGHLNGSLEHAGFNLEDNSGNVLFSYWQQGGNNPDGNYLDANGAGTATGFAYDFNKMDSFAFTLNSLTSYTFSDLTTGNSLTGILSGIAIAQVQVFRANLAGDPATGGGGGTDFLFNNLSLTTVPEPSSVALAGISGVGMLLALRRRMR